MTLFNGWGFSTAKMMTDRSGIGLTSQRVRNRLVQQLREMGISSDAVLNVISSIWHTELKPKQRLWLRGIVDIA